MSEIHITPAWKDVKPSLAYVYIHRRLSDMTEFYVGKGNVARAWSKNRAASWLMEAELHGVFVDVVQDGMTDDDAYLLECWLIAKLTHEGCNLVNKISGGGGPVIGGFKPVMNSDGQRFDGLSSAVRWLKENGHPNAVESKISVCCNGRDQRHSAYGCSWWFEGDEEKEFIPANERRAEKFGKPIITNLGERFESARAAASWLRDNGWPSASDSKIASCRNGKRKTAYGRTWCDEGCEPIVWVDPKKAAGAKRFKPVVRGDGVEYASITDAAKDVSGSLGRNYLSVYSSIATCLRDKNRSSAYGFTWSYA